MGAKEIIAAEKAFVEEEVHSLFQREAGSCMDERMARSLLSSLRDYTLRDGKRIRAVLMVLGYRASGGRDMDRIRRAAVSMELVQDMLLIHDDLMDGSPERRGGPSLHEHFRSVHGAEGLRGDPTKFGSNMALIGGDLAEALAVKVLAQADFSPDRTVRALTCYADMVRDTGYGQVLDMSPAELPVWTREDVLRVHRFKTARYTFEGPLLIGASLSGADGSQLEALSGYSIPVGTAFQLIDDIIGLFGDPRRGGKDDLSDIREGKRTLLMVEAYSKAKPANRKRLLEHLGDSELTNKGAEWVRSLVMSTGAVESSRALARELTDEGIAALSRAELDRQVKTTLEDMANGLLERA